MEDTHPINFKFDDLDSTDKSKGKKSSIVRQEFEFTSKFTCDMSSQFLFVFQSKLNRHRLV